MYKALLKWSLAQSYGTSGPSTAMPMTDEKRKFLAAAMESYVLDETKRMQDILTILKYKRDASADVACDDDISAEGQPPSPPSSVPTPSTGSTLCYSQIVEGAVAARLTQKKKETTFIPDTLASIPAAKLQKIKVDALCELSERVEQIDNATYFACGAGGSGELPVLFGFVKEGATPLQAEACNVLKIILQNNPKCQEKALKIGGMNVLLAVTQTHPEMDMRVKAFSCLSALLRYGNAVPVLAFADAGGLEKCVMPALTNNDAPRLQKKALFFLQYAVSADDSFPAKRFLASGIVQTLGTLLGSEDDDIVEQSATILIELLSNPTGLDNNMGCLQDHRLKVKDHLKKNLLSLAAKPAEEREYYVEMISLIKKLYGLMLKYTVKE